MRILIVLTTLLATCSASKSSSIPLYRKDLPYCASSLVYLSGDDKVREVWSIKDGGDYTLDLRTHTSSYCPHDRNVTAVQFDLGRMKRIAGVLVTGKRQEETPLDKYDIDTLPPWTEDMWVYYATHYTVEHSPDSRIWTEIKDELGNPRHFKMTQSYEEAAAIKSKWEIFIRAHLQTFDPNIHARFIRINVQAFIKKGCIGRVDVIGCDSDLSTNNVQRVEVAEPSKIERGECSHVSTLGMQSGEITDGQIEASSFDHYSYPGFARWDNPHQMQWCANTSHDKSPWIMVGFPTSRFLTKVLYKGEIKGYKVDIELTLDGKTWTKYESRSRSFFSATLCCGFHEEFYIYPVIKVRYVRLAFKRDWYGPYKACAMFEVFGCSAETQTLSWFPPLIARVKPHIEISPGTWDRKDVRYMAMGEDPYLSYCFKTSKIYFDFGNPSFKEPTYNRVEFDMKKMFALTKVIIRGDLSPSKECGPYVKSMAIMYSMDRTTWTMVRYYNGKNDWRLRIKVHPAVKSECQVATVHVVPVAVGRFFKFVPGHYDKHFQCWKIEMMGFEPGVQPIPPRTPRKNNPACNDALGMENGAIKASKISATSSQTGAQPSQGRLNGGGAWCPDKIHHVHTYTAANNSLEIDLEKEYIIDGFASQGHMKTDDPRWVMAYVVHYSEDGASWDIIKSSENDWVFRANADCCGVVRQYLNPRVRARYVRFVPVAWHTWPCMRVEIYGCLDGTSYKSRLFKKLRDLETQKLFLAHLTPNNPLHFNCGDYETWGKTNYLKINLDREKSIWYQKAFGRDFPIVEKTLSLATNQFPSEFGSRHFMCRGRTRDGMDIFHQHLIVVPDGPRKASWLTPIENMKTNPSSVIPQVVVIQRFDPTYDGGFPVWSEPAVVKAVGNTASLAVFVLGIPYYPMIIHNCLVENRLSDWHLTHLGTVARNDTQACARLALSRGYEYMIILAETECMSSWYMPLATSAHRLRDEGQCRLEPRAYFIQATFEEYNIAWYKRIEDDKYPWKRLFSYPIRPRDKSSSHIFSVAANGHILQERVRPFSYGGHFQTFDKALFGDTYTGSHVMDIRDITVEDLGAYKFEVTVPSRGVRNEAIILLQHEGGPSIDLPERYSACEAVPGPLTVKPVEDNLLEPEELQVQAWYFSFLIGEELQRWTTTDDISFKWEGRWRETFVWTHPLPIDNGKFIEVFVKNHYGMASALAQIEVAPVDETPYPEWVTPSPFQAIDGFSQLLEVKLRSDKQLESVTWFHDDKPIEVATDRYAFPGSTAGIRTKLKLVTIDEKTPGNYKVVITGKYCQFERSIHVKVIVVPRVTFLPRADFVVAKVNDKEVIFNATVKGGNPKPKMQEMTWRKGENKMIASYSGRIVLFTTLNEQSNWFSVLKISKLRATDTAQYTFEINSGPAITKKTWQLSVRETGAVNTTYFPAGERPSKIADHSFSSPKPTSSYNTIILPFTILILLILN